MRGRPESRLRPWLLFRSRCDRLLAVKASFTRGLPGLDVNANFSYQSNNQRLVATASVYCKMPRLREPREPTVA